MQSATYDGIANVILLRVAYDNMPVIFLYRKKQTICLNLALLNETITHNVINMTFNNINTIQMFKISNGVVYLGTLF